MQKAGQKTTLYLKPRRSNIIVDLIRRMSFYVADSSLAVKKSSHIVHPWYQF